MARMVMSIVRAAAVARSGAGAWPLAPALWGSLAWRGRRLQRVLQQASALLASTLFVAEWYAAHGAPRDRVRTFPLGVDLPPGFPTGAQATVPPAIGAAGRAGAAEGQPCRGGPRWPRWVTGSNCGWRATTGRTSSYVMALRRQAATPNVRLAGAAGPSRGVGCVWPRVDAVLVPSLWYETYSYALHEALAAGVPVMVSDLGVMAGAVRTASTGGACRPAMWRLG